jgi:hypothetical protein
MKEDSDSDLSEEMHDQLSELWTSAQIKRKAMLEKLTLNHRKPAYNTAPNYKHFPAREKPEEEKTKNYTDKE